jgi:glutaredoxin
VCSSTKKALNQNGVAYVEYQIGVNITREDVLAKFPNAKTVPIIILNGAQIDASQAQQLLMEKEEHNAAYG